MELLDDERLDLVSLTGVDVDRDLHKAVLYFTLITFAYLFGMWLADFRNVSLENFQLHFIAEIFYGGATLLALVLTRGLGLTHEIPNLDAGVLFSSVAGRLASGPSCPYALTEL